MNPQTVGDLGPALEALYRILNQFAHLPAATFEAGKIVLRSGVAPGVSITLHHSYAAFEAWREALDIDPATVDRWESSHDSHDAYAVLEGETAFAGVPVRLRGFTSPVRVPAAPDTVAA
ncbi:hypothetical protein SNS2_1542 [Streptomyces netropsis]|nr:hypothetical protein SNS2_1542 [Streptomyces netropsis]